MGLILLLLFVDGLNLAMRVKSARCTVVVATIPDGDLFLNRLSVKVIQQGKQFHEKRRQQYLVGRILLAELLFELFGIAELLEIQIDQNGRPIFFEDYLPDFNISHSGNQVMVALGMDCCCGLDLERNRDRIRSLDLAKYNFSELECQWLSFQAGVQQKNSFWQLWTLRESTLKLVGKSVWQMNEIKIDPYKETILASFISEQYSCSVQTNTITWALTSSKKLTKEDIELKQFDWHSKSFDTVVIREIEMFNHHEESFSDNSLMDLSEFEKSLLK